MMTRQNKTSVGDDNTVIAVLKKLSFDNLLKITIIFNHLLASAFYPSAWKHAIECPIPKPDKDSTYIANFRPISLLNSISKIFEIILKRSIMSVLNNGKITTTILLDIRAAFDTVWHNGLMMLCGLSSLLCIRSSKVFFNKSIHVCQDKWYTISSPKHSSRCPARKL